MNAVTFVCCICWTINGYVYVNSVQIWVQNGCGVVSSAVALFFRFLYRNAKRDGLVIDDAEYVATLEKQRETSRLVRFVAWVEKKSSPRSVWEAQMRMAREVAAASGVAASPKAAAAVPLETQDSLTTAVASASTETATL